MSNAQALKGTIKVEGYSKSKFSAPSDSNLFSEVHEVSGSTIGELLDNLVEASVLLASSAFTWAVMNRSALYAPANDKWNVTVSFPEVIQPNGDQHILSNHLICQGTLINFDSIVKYAVKVRNDQITQAAFNLILVKVDEPSAITDELKVPQTSGKQSESFHELTQHGYTGGQLDLILAIAEKEGRIQEYSAQNALIDSFPPREFLPRDKFQENIFI